MKARECVRLLVCGLVLSISATETAGQVLTQTFEPGEDTSNWGANWVAPGGFSANAAGFLDASTGGANAGFASTQIGQEAYRDFRNNTVGIDEQTTPYSVSLYVKLNLNPGGTPASGHFNVMDGTFGDYTGNIRLTYNAGSPGILEAADGGGWQTLNVNLNIASPYRFQFTVDPIARTYSTTVAEVNSAGAVLSSATLNNLAITGNAINNGQNGQLLFHVDTSAGFIDWQVDNIQVSPIPEPGAVTAVSGAVVGLFAIGRRLRLKNRRS